MVDSGSEALLKPILVCGPNRGGSTALMALLTSDARVAADQIHPFENCLLTYCLKLALLQSRFDRPGAWNIGQMLNFGDSEFGAYPYRPSAPAGTPPSAVLGQPTEAEWFRGLWQTIAEYIRRRRPGAAWYAEKVPSWVPTYAGSDLGATTIYLFRDPRDIFLSANALMKKLDYYSFGRKPQDDDTAYAREFASAYLMLFENYRSHLNKPGSILLRYEDLARDAQAVSGVLNEKLGLCVNIAGMNRTPQSHRTSASLASSIERWRREGLPPGVEGTLMDGLDEAIGSLGYAPARAEPGMPKIDCTRRQDVAGLQHNSHGRFADVTEEGLEIIPEGDDFSIWLPEWHLDASQVHECWLTVRARIGTHCSVYWDSGQGFGEEESIHQPFFPADHWQIIRFGVARRAKWAGTIHRIRFDLCNGGAISPYRRIYLRSVRLIR